jgi:hypothetical protein
LRGAGSRANKIRISASPSAAIATYASCWCAHVVMGRFGPDCALRRWALERAGGSRTAKKRTVVAGARKLAVLLHRLWLRQEQFRPFPAIG